MKEKKNNYTENQQEMANLFKALGHPARVAIIEHLLEINTCIVGDIVDELPLAQPTVSRHLKELKNLGLIKGSIEGNTICYCIDNNGIEKLYNYFSDFQSKLNNQKDSSC